MGWQDGQVVESAPAWASSPAVQEPQANRPYKPFATVRKDIEADSLNTDQDWLLASRKLYEAFEQKQFEGSDAELAAWGKDTMAYFNYNTVGLARVGNAVVNGTQDQKEAFLWMMDTFDNTNMSWEGTGRFAENLITDPLTYVGIGTIGAGFLAKEGGKTVAKQELKSLLVQAIGRTGITAGVEGGVMAATDSSARQFIEMDAGRRDEFSVGKLAVDTAVGATAGVVLGTTADVAVTKITQIASGLRVKDTPQVNSKKPPATKADAQAADEVIPGATKVDNAAQDVAQATDEVIPGSTKVDAEGKPLGSTLTQAEIDAATSRKQKGRLPEDDTTPVSTGTTSGKIELDIPGDNTGLRTTAQNMEELTGRGGQIAEQLRVLNNADLDKALEVLRTGSLPLEQTRVVARGVQMYADELRIRQAELLKKMNGLKDGPELAQLSKQADEIAARLEPLNRADDAFGSMAGSILRQRQEGLPGVEGLSVQKIMDEEGLSRVDAEQAFAERITRAQQGKEVRNIEAGYDSKISQALAEGNFEQAARLTAERSRTVNAITNQYVPESKSIVAKATEYAISMVFTVKTLFMNVIPSGVKTLVIPVAKAIARNPMEKAVRVEMAASYNAMLTTSKSAFKAAVEAFKYESSFLTRDTNRLLEGGMALGGRVGGAIRLFPRLLNATDEFLSQINYASYVAGKAAGDAAVEATNKGLTGKRLDDAINKAVDKAYKDAFEGNTGDDIVNPIITKGMNLGLTDEALFKYVEREIAGDAGLLNRLGYQKDLSVMRRGTDEEALNFVRDVLYKRDFSGSGTASKVAQKFDGWFREFPSLKLISGQLFFRTPIRVFEEGIRLTPGLQIIAPGFIRDLSGQNGVLRQVRAQGEAMVSLGIAGYTMALYAGGRITGDGAYSDYQQQRLRGDGPKQPPYTIRFSDGSTWSYRNFDPIATPVKIMVNALERARVLELRQAQGEFVNASEFQKVTAAMTVAVGAISRAVTDAGLTEGVNQLVKWAEAMSDPEANEGATLRLIAQKLNLTVPNTLRKVARDNDPTMKDPATFWQVVEQSILGPVAGAFGGDSKLQTAYSYDVLGNPRKSIPGGAVWDFFSTQSVEERGKGLSAESQFVLSELDRISRVTGATFKTPIKHPKLGSMDLRTIMASDGKRTLYDVWQDNYRALNPTGSLYPILNAPLPDGTFKHKGLRVEQVRNTISTLQEAAFNQLMAQERKVLDRVIYETINKAQSKVGVFDTPRR